MNEIKTPNFRLIVSLKLGEEAAFRIIFNLYSHKLYTFSFRLLKDSAQSEEIVQDTFLNLWVNREKLREELPIAPYLYTITRRLTLNALRHIAVSQLAENNLKKDGVKENNVTEEAIFLNDLEEFTEKVLTKLPHQQQLIYRMSRHENLNYVEIGERLNISRNTVRNHLVAALKSLREHFEHSGIIYLIFFSFNCF